MIFKESIEKLGFISEPISKDIDIKKEIVRLKKEKNAIILAHFYQADEIQEIADFVGDSLALAQKAQNNSADIIVFAGVNFMAETAKILSPHKKVLLPDLNAGCSLADSCPPDEFKSFLEKYPDHTVISYVNTSAAIKMLTDIVCTSSNAVQIIESLPKDEKIIFAPDRNLGAYISKLTQREMVIWDGACTVHEKFSLEKIIQLKNENPHAKIIAHPECVEPILLISDYIGSTSNLLQFSQQDSSDTYIVVTEPGILFKMQNASPHKKFIPAPPNDSTCACNNCEFMRLITLEKMYNTLKYELPEIHLEKNVIELAKVPILRMLEISEKLGL
ncbi:MAG: quinolinate synthase NadA [Bacteroidales bacterium]|nr:quinolinate synthase NadA [Bacteroidales bacterium]NLK81796.1 quinolinate synthase NadA [Bacteroidales bacterium]